MEAIAGVGGKSVYTENDCTIAIAGDGYARINLPSGVTWEDIKNYASVGVNTFEGLKSTIILRKSSTGNIQSFTEQNGWRDIALSSLQPGCADTSIYAPHAIAQIVITT